MLSEPWVVGFPCYHCYLLVVNAVNSVTQCFCISPSPWERGPLWTEFIFTFYSGLRGQCVVLHRIINNYYYNYYILFNKNKIFCLWMWLRKQEIAFHARVLGLFSAQSSLNTAIACHICYHIVPRPQSMSLYKTGSHQTLFHKCMRSSSVKNKY